MKTHLFVIVLLIGSLSACGGGGSDKEENIKASVNAGVDQTVEEKSSFTLSAVTSPVGGVVSWSVQDGSAIEGLPAEGTSVTLEAPDIKIDSQYVVLANYTATDGSVVSDTVNITVLSKNQIPSVTITQTGPETQPSKWLDTITLSAAESADPDENGQLVSFEWQQLSGVALTPLSLSESTLSFIHPLLANNETVIWQVTVTDDEGGQAHGSFSIVLGKNGQLVFANAGGDETVTEFDTVSLDASDSVSVSNEYTCFWQLQSGPVATASRANDCTTFFIAPNVDIATEMRWLVLITDRAGYSGSAVKRVNVEPMKLGLMNDSGQVTCYTENAQVSCSDSAAIARQDAMSGRDSAVARLAKTGVGDNGFDFTKLNEFADELPNDASKFSCVRDNVTGLIWEVKQPAQGTLPNVELRAANNHYTWAKSGATGNVYGAPNSTCQSDVDCAISTYVNEVNSTNYCGGSNWRVPTYTELMGILDFGKTAVSNLMPSNFFPNVPSASLLGHVYYWTSQTSADGASLSQAYILDMQTGNDLAYPKAQTAYVRLVRTP
ncbi:protein of unknown function DUF1566 [Pseudoalteromonas luteoviolacea B = ATCC 29581]|nr:protein of unknown function DUF1566 [Pseudoalteromonas luteoviolacea B = ATCC 29581]